MKLNSEQYLKHDINLFLELPFWLTSMFLYCDKMYRIKKIYYCKKNVKENVIFVYLFPALFCAYESDSKETVAIIFL